MLAAITACMGCLSLLSSLTDRSGRRQHRIAQVWGRMLMAVFLVRVRIVGAEDLSPDRPYVFASNHFSLLDTPLMFGFLPVEFRILARDGLWRIPFIGWHLDRAGHLPVNRTNPRRAVRNITYAAQKVRERRMSILVFPEGGRRRGGQMRRFKTGAAHIAIRSGVPLVPVAIDGTGEILPPGSWHLRPGVVEVRIGEPFQMSQRSWTAKQLTESLRERIAELAACSGGGGPQRGDREEA